jgi:hypothetical protein
MLGVISATVTGTMGNGQALSAVSFLNQRSIHFDAVTAMLTLTDVNDKVVDISIAAATTVTVTLSGAAGNYTVVVS